MSPTKKVTTITFDADSVRTTRGRRRFLSQLALAVGSVSLAPYIGRGLGITQLQAQGTDGETEPNLSDTDILNYALSLEYLEATFYLRADASGTLPSGATSSDIDPDGAAAPGSVPGLDAVTFPAPSTVSAATFFRAVRDHEITHVLALRGALGGDALARGDFAFDFGTAFDSADNFLAVSQALEDTGVSAYLGQTANLDDTGILTTAGSILGVEAEHAAAVRLLTGQPVTVDNGDFDTPRTSTEVLAIAGGFITQAPELPFP